MYKNYLQNLKKYKTEKNVTCEAFKKDHTNQTIIIYVHFDQHNFYRNSLILLITLLQY